VPQAKRLSLPVPLGERYEYLGDLRASGGEADIALLVDRQTGEEVILKWYRAGLTPDPFAMRLLQSADPEHIVRLIDFHDAADGTWELQERCRLGSLREWVEAQGGRLPDGLLAAAVEQIANALDYLHSLGQGIAHRDLKPSNVLVRSADPLDLVLADFGLARAQQAVTHVTTTVKGTWHYAAPEVYTQKSSQKSDWFSLGAMVYEFYTGRQLFALADGSPVTEEDARSRCQDGDYSTELVGDNRWRLLCDGLLTWEREDRWGQEEVTAWLRGESPEVASPGRAAAGLAGDGAGEGVAAGGPARSRFRPSWSPAVIQTGPELARQLRLHAEDAANALAGRPDEKLIAFLRHLPGGAEAARVVSSGEGAGAKIIRLQAFLDPEGPLTFGGAVLDRNTLDKRVKAAAKGDGGALDWLEAVLAEGVLTAYAEALGAQELATADYWLSKWKDQADSAIAPLPGNLAQVGRRAWRDALPELFLEALRRAELENEGSPARPQA
jgi:hypothetical protein